MKIQLSISLLASNRAASLERCLDSLKPLLMKVPSELIVVFTGQDERVREIAAKYTDHIIPFTWCDNFSAARNVGLWAAKGEWFLYIDDDEWFDDVTEICDFFLSGAYLNYGSACYKQRNYSDWNGVRHSDFHAFRMAKIVPGIGFQNAIHEEIVPQLEPCKYFDAYVHHYGYVSKTGAKTNEEKTSRNVPLLLESIKERPSYVKNYLQIVLEYCGSEEWEEAEKYCRKGRELCKGTGDTEYQRWLQVNLIESIYHQGDPERTRREAEAILKKENPPGLVKLELARMLVGVYDEKRDPEGMLKYGTLFEKTLVSMDQDPQLWRKQQYGDLTEEKVKSIGRLLWLRLKCTEAALEVGDAKRATDFLLRLPWEEESQMQQYYPLFDQWKRMYGECFQELLKEFPAHSPYLALQKVQEERISSEEKQALLMQSMDGTESFYLQQQAVEKAVLSEQNLSILTDTMDLDTWKRCVPDIVAAFPLEESEKLWNAVESLRQGARVYGLWLEKALWERELVRGYQIHPELIEALRAYVECVLSFYKLQYREEMFERENRNLLSKDCRFVLLLDEALKSVEEMKLPEAVRLFRLAIAYYPTMTGVIREVIRHMAVEADNPALGAGEEFQALAQQMKAALHTMLDNRQYPEAMAIVNQLSPLLPEDLEFLRMRQQVWRQMTE
ncbi:MAG: glycosyltransferase [Hespellia sp.]|nr:glycosyltransferase [Hespellia sp.]